MRGVFVKPGADQPGFAVELEYDRGTLERFRQKFPRARWRPEEKSWFVPGTTAARRVASFLEFEATRSDRFADEKGRDGFSFEPIVSPYLEASSDLIVKTPFSHGVVKLLRSLPLARWDRVERAWHLPFRSFEALKALWPSLEEEAHRAEPGERRRRREVERGTNKAMLARKRASELARRRHPLLAAALPALGRPVDTATWGMVSFEKVTGEVVGTDVLESLYPDLYRLAGAGHYVWGKWRRPSLAELVREWPARDPPTIQQMRRGWWRPLRPELTEARRKARARERR
ncbi:hypothetical protein LPJGGPFB_05113 [Ensifer adhaerens]|uniref:hypothetical protein n=1 Tax=Ensifer adhaerens TaxID=106592 RepID=UPI00156A39A1|nr:hypothetical protein [Ensifer adhaerens]NRP21854.1 hypothetical protein [Ensifer adhaerens]